MTLAKRFCSVWTAIVVLVTTLASPVRAAETLTFIHTDVGGSPIAATDIGGNPVWRESYRPYGERTRNEPDAAGNRQFFHGKAYDADTGLSYFGARYYDPLVGRFMGVDPQPFDQENLHSFNRYAYGNNNPYKFVDPDGHAAETILDIVSVGLSIAAFKQDPSILNGLGLAYDVVAAATPFLPAGFGILKHAGKAADTIGDAGKVTREQRWLQLANEPNTRLPKEVVDHVNRHEGKGVAERFGLELAHKPKKAAAQGHDYSEAIPKTIADHRGIEHRHLRERRTGTTINTTPKERSGGRLDLPPPGSLP